MKATKFFLSHTWHVDTLGRDTHERVRQVAASLRKIPFFDVWLDDENMVDDIDACMSNGIDKCDFVIVFITRKYCDKIQEAACNPRISDNCYKEFSYAVASQKKIIPVVFEPSLRQIVNWPNGIIKMNLAPKLYVDGSESSPDEISSKIFQNVMRLQKKNQLPPKRHRRAPILQRSLSSSKFVPTNLILWRSPPRILISC